MLWGVEMPPHEKGYTQINTLGGEQTFCRGVVKHYPIVPNVDSIHIGRKQLFVNPIFNLVFCFKNDMLKYIIVICFNIDKEVNNDYIPV